MDETVNFWDYATHEYCFDSFICYLLRIEKTKKAFFRYCGIDEKEEIQDKGIQQQRKNVDVFVETDKSFLIIEDKVDSTEHDEQLKRYIEEVQKRKSSKTIHACYIKLGYLSEQEKRDIEENLNKIDFPMKNLHFIDLPELLKVANLAESNIIIEQWIDKYEKELEKQNNILKEIKADIASGNYEELYVKVFKRDNDKKDYLRPYLDMLTEKIRKETSYEASWSLEGYKNTPHIELEYTERKQLANKHWESHSLFIMFRKKGPQLVLKQHFYEKKNGNNRIGTGMYSSMGLDEVLSASKDNISSLKLPEDWEKVSKKNKKDKLMLCKKMLNVSDDLVEVLKTEKENIDAIFKKLKK